MMVSRAVVVVVVLFGFLFSFFQLSSFVDGCPFAFDGSDFTTDPTDFNTFTDQRQHQHLSLSSNFHFFLKLHSNPTTGYSWLIHPSTTADLINRDPQQLHLIACQYQQNQPKHHQQLVGVGGEELWEFSTGSATNRSKVTIALQYQRPWIRDKQRPDAVWNIEIGYTGINE